MFLFHICPPECGIFFGENSQEGNLYHSLKISSSLVHSFLKIHCIHKIYYTTEQFLIGMPIEEVPRTVSTICGVCRGVHFTAALKASDEIYGVTPTPVAKKLREMLFLAHMIEDHMEVLYALGLPDFVCGPTAPPAERNIIGLIRNVGVDMGKDVLKKRFSAVRIFEILGGKPSHPVAGIPEDGQNPLQKKKDRKSSNLQMSV